MYQTIVLAFDGSREGRAALSEGIELAALCDAGVHLVSVMEVAKSCAFTQGIYALEEIANSEMSDLTGLVDEGLEQIRNRGIREPNGHIALGQPVEQISHLARKIQADLIVVGHKHRSPLTRWWQGSLSRRLIDEANCSVLVALHPEDDQRG